MTYTEDYRALALNAGATHTGQKGHGWRRCPTTGNWQVFKIGAGWSPSEPQTELTPLVIPKLEDKVPRHYIDLIQQFHRVDKMLMIFEEAQTIGALYDLRKEVDKLGALFDER